MIGALTTMESIGGTSQGPVDATGALKQSASGRVVVQVTGNFSTVLDEHVLGTIEPLQREEMVDTSAGYNLQFQLTFCLLSCSIHCVPIKTETGPFVTSSLPLTKRNKINK